MGEVADKSGIQFRLLNRSRGGSKGPRTQSDRSLYKKFMQKKLVNYCNLSIFSDPNQFIFKNNTIIGLLTNTGKGSIFKDNFNNWHIFERFNSYR